MTGPVPERTRPETCLSDLAIEQFLLCEPQAKGAAAPIEAHLISCQRCAQRREELAAAPAQVPDRLWWQQQTENIPRRRGWRSHLGFGVGAGALSVAAAVALVLVVRTKPATEVPSGVDDTRTKGVPLALQLVARRSDGKIERVFEDTVLHPDDQIQFIVTLSQPGYLAVVGLDAGQQVSVYFPTANAPSESLPAGTHDLPVSIILDETLGAEQIVALSCPSAPDAATLTRAGRDALARATPERARLDAPALPCWQTSITIRKAARP